MFRKRFWKRFAVVLATGFVLCTGLYLFRHAILLAAGQGLIRTDPLQKADAVFIPGGSVYNRGVGAAYLYRQGFADTIVTLGGNSPSSLMAYGVRIKDAVLNTRMLIRFCHVPPGHIITDSVGTSSFEEMEAMMQLSAAHGWDTVMVVSDYFHTRRLRYTVELVSKGASPVVLIAGCPNIYYKTGLWWQSEAGLIALNNEYLKLLYYHWRY